MNTYKLKINGIRFEIEQEPRGEQHRVLAYQGKQTAIGWLSYNRLEFRFVAPQWLQEKAHHRYWTLDDYETGKDAQNRPTDTCTFDLTDQQEKAIDKWLPLPHPKQNLPNRSRRDYVEPIFGIGALNKGDGAEVQTPWPKSGMVCRKCGEAESDGAMFTTLSNQNICDDCAG